MSRIMALTYLLPQCSLLLAVEQWKLFEVIAAVGDGSSGCMSAWNEKG